MKYRVYDVALPIRARPAITQSNHLRLRMLLTVTIDIRTVLVYTESMILCDACHAAKPVYLAKKGTYELYFCGHHFTKHEMALELWADSLESLDKQPAMV